MQPHKFGTVEQSATRLHIAHIRGLLTHIDYQDTFSIELPHDCTIPVHVFAHAMFAIPPKAVLRLMQLRNMLVKPLGLRTGEGERTRFSPLPEPATPETGKRIGIFTVRYCNDELLLFMEADKHLDFVVALRREERDGEGSLHLSTCVQYHNATGKIYFTIVKPFHKWIVAQCMREGVERVLAHTSP